MVHISHQSFVIKFHKLSYLTDIYYRMVLEHGISELKLLAGHASSETSREDLFQVSPHFLY